MKLPRPRLTIRRMMVAVAILAVCLRGGLWLAEMRRLSKFCHQKAQDFVSSTERRQSSSHTTDGRTINRFDDENARIEDAYALSMAEKYWNVSNFPWQTAEPDPPRPAKLKHPTSAYVLPDRDEKLKDIWTRQNKPPV